MGGFNLALLAWGAVAEGAFNLRLEFVAFTLFSAFTFVGIGALLVEIARVPRLAMGWIAARWALGVSAAYVVALALAYLRVSVATVWVLAAAAAAGWIWLLVAAMRPAGFSAGARAIGRMLGERSLAGEALMFSAVLRVVIEGSRAYAPFRTTRVQLLQHWDLSFHLAMAREGIERGLPIARLPIVAGFERPAYHIAFDTLTATLMKSLGLVTDEAFYSLLVPFAYLAFVLATWALLRAWSGGVRAANLGAAMLGLTAAGALLSEEFVASFGRFGLTPLQFFLFNPGAVVGTTAIAVAMALVIVAPRGREGWAYAVAGVLVGSTVAMKANFAMAACPAFAIALLVSALRRRISWKAFLAGVVPAVAFGLISLVYFSGPGAGIGFGWAAMSEYIQTAPPMKYSGELWRQVAALAGRTGAAGDTAFLLLYIALGMTGWRLWIVVGSAVVRRIRGERAFEPMAAADGGTFAWFWWLYLGLLVVLAFTIVQKLPWVTLTWNVGWHDIQVVWWASILLAALMLDGALPERLVPALAGVAAARNRRGPRLRRVLVRVPRNDTRPRGRQVCGAAPILPHPAEDAAVGGRGRVGRSERRGELRLVGLGSGGAPGLSRERAAQRAHARAGRTAQVGHHPALRAEGSRGRLPPRRRGRYRVRDRGSGGGHRDASDRHRGAQGGALAADPHSLAAARCGEVGKDTQRQRCR